MKRMALFAGGIAVVLAALFVASALKGHRSSEIPVVTADTKPVRVKPENPGGMKIDGAENDLFSGNTDTASAKLAPPAEAPDTKALRADTRPPPPPVIAQAPAAAAPAPVKPAVVASAPPTAPAPKAAAAAPAPAVTAKPVAVSGGKTMVQLAALGSEEAARNEWALLSKKMPELLNGRQPSYSRTEHDGRTFWRLRTAGFADVAQARSFCEHVRSKGTGCSVADF